MSKSRRLTSTFFPIRDQFIRDMSLRLAEIFKTKKENAQAEIKLRTIFENNFIQVLSKK